MFRVSKKFLLKKIIRDFSRSNYSNLEKKVEEAHRIIKTAQVRTLDDPTVLNAKTELKAQRKWSIFVIAKESFFCQRSRITWLKEADLNTSYFHRMTSTRQAINHIHYLVSENGQRFDTQSAIHEHCLDYYKNLLGSEESPPIFHFQDMPL